MFGVSDKFVALQYVGFLEQRSKRERECVCVCACVRAILSLHAYISHILGMKWVGKMEIWKNEYPIYFVSWTYFSPTILGRRSGGEVSVQRASHLCIAQELPCTAVLCHRRLIMAVHVLFAPGEARRELNSRFLDKNQFDAFISNIMTLRWRIGVSRSSIAEHIEHHSQSVGVLIGYIFPF